MTNNKEKISDSMIINNDEYITKEEAEKTLGYSLQYCISVLKTVKSYKKVDGVSYISREEVEELLNTEKELKEEYITKKEAEKALGYSLMYKINKLKAIKYKKVKGIIYVKREEVEELLKSENKLKEEYITVVEAEKTLGYSLQYCISVLKTVKSYKKVDGVSYISREEVEELLNTEKELKEEYITKKEAEKALGYSLKYKTNKLKAIKYKKVKGIIYVKREEVEELLKSENKLKEEYITVVEAEKTLGYSLRYRISVLKTVKSYKRVYGVSYISREEVEELLNTEKELKEEYITKEEAEKTLGYNLSYKINNLKLIKYKRIKGRTYVKREEVEELLKSKNELKEEYMTVAEAEKALGYCLSYYIYSIKTVKSHKIIDGCGYISREEVEVLLNTKKEFKEEYMARTEAAKLIGYNRIKVLVKSKKIKTYKLVNGVGFISHKEVKELIESANNLEDNYISLLEIEKDFDIKFKKVNRGDYLETYEKYAGKAYIKKTELEEIRKLKNETISRLNFTKNNNLLNNTVENAIKVLKIKEIIKNPFYDVKNLLSNEDADRILDYLEYKEEKTKNVGFVEKFKFHIKEMPINFKIEKTIGCFNKFVVKKSKSYKTENSIRAKSKIYANAYMILLNSLDREFNEYSQNQIDSILSLLTKNSKYMKNSKKLFVHFINYIIKDWKLKKYKKYKISNYKSSERIVGYTQKQFLELLTLLHNGVKNRSYLSHAIANKMYAMAWLYMYLHYIMIWRGSDLIEKLSSPDLLHLNIPNVNNGKSFLNWLLDEKNIFTDEMGEIMSEDVRQKMHALNKRTGKTNQRLFMEIGRLTAPVLGLLLAICEAHREIAEKSGHKCIKTDTILTKSIMTQHKENGIYNMIFEGKVIDILGEIFGNRKANKSYNNYIQNYSEERHRKFAVHLISILRGYVDEESQTTTIYETRKSEGTIDAVVATLFQRGSFAFAKFKLLEVQEESFLSLDFDNQSEVINNLELTPYQSEVAVKNIYNARRTVTSLLAKMSTQPMKMQEIMKELAFGDTESKHNHARCLYKACLNSGISEVKDLDVDNIDGFMFIEILKEYRNNANCIHPETPTCFGCPMMIGEMYLLYELKEVLFETINKLKNCKSEFEQYIYSDILHNSYMPILREAKVTLGATYVGFIINSENLKNELYKLHAAGKIKLKEFTGGKNDCNIKQIRG